MAHKSGKSSYAAKPGHPGRKGGKMMKGMPKSHKGMTPAEHKRMMKGR